MQSERREAPAGAEEEMLELKRILVPVDFEACSRRALRVALSLARASGAVVDVLHVWVPPDYVSPAHAVALGKGDARALEEVALRESRIQLWDFIDRTGRPPDVEVRATVSYGLPHDVILEMAGGYDLIVMGTHGRKGLSRLVMGSVAERVLKQSPKPVLVSSG